MANADIISTEQGANKYIHFKTEKKIWNVNTFFFLQLYPL